MSFEIPLPTFRAEDEFQRGLYSYLYQTVQQLNWAMKHIQREADGGELSFGRAGVTGSVSGQKDTQSQVRDLILKSADIVEAFSAAVSRRFQGQYTARSEFGDYREQTELWIRETDKRIEQNFTNLQSITGTVEGMWDRMAVTDAYVRSGLIGEEPDGTPVYGLEIGQTNQLEDREVFRKYARFTSSRLSFYDRNDTEVAYISDFRLYITNVQVTGNLILGNFEVDTTEGLAFRWIGGA